MDTRLDESIFDLENIEFYESYLPSLISRVTNATMELESDLGNPVSSKNAIRFKDNMLAFSNLINKSFSKTEITEELII